MTLIVTKILGLAGKLFWRSNIILGKRKDKYVYMHDRKVHWNSKGVDQHILISTLAKGV
jgi:hypothetical protein